MCGERQCSTVEQSLAGCISEGLKHTVEFDYVQLADVFFGKQRGEVTQKSRSNPVGGRDAPAFLFFEGNNTGLPRQHLNGNPQNARQQLFKIKFLGEGAGYLKQVVTLTNT